MHLVYTAFTQLPTNNQQIQNNNSEVMLRYLAYQTTCEKFSAEIAAIQKYLPDWVPKFR